MSGFGNCDRFLPLSLLSASNIGLLGLHADALYLLDFAIVVSTSSRSDSKGHAEYEVASKSMSSINVLEQVIRGCARVSASRLHRVGRSCKRCRRSYARHSPRRAHSRRGLSPRFRLPRKSTSRSSSPSCGIASRGMFFSTRLWPLGPSPRCGHRGSRAG
jgi:hypothetical protein